MLNTLVFEIWNYAQKHARYSKKCEGMSKKIAKKRGFLPLTSSGRPNPRIFLQKLVDLDMGNISSKVECADRGGGARRLLNCPPDVRRRVCTARNIITHKHCCARKLMFHRAV